MTSVIPMDAARVRMHDFSSRPLSEQAVYGMAQPEGQKFIPTPYVYERPEATLTDEEARYFREEVGSQDIKNDVLASGADIFSRIEKHPDYYVGHAEEDLLASRELRLLREGHVVTEFGPGNGDKTLQFLFTNLPLSNVTYQAIDVSPEFLDMTMQKIEMMGIKKRSCCNDFFTASHGLARADVALFFGTTISNFEPDMAIRLLRHMRESYLKDDGLLVLGQDGNQDIETLQLCYDDRGRHTASFVMNALRQIRQDHAPGLCLSDFAYKAYFDKDAQTMRMGIESKTDKIVQIGHMPVQFAAGEFIRVGQSRKYPAPVIGMLAAEAGFDSLGAVSSPHGVNVHVLKPKGLNHG